MLELRAEDVGHWLMRARAAGAPLAVVCTATSIDLYSTEAGRRAAFTPLLASLWSLGRNFSDFANVRTTEATGSEVVRHLLRQAAGLDAGEDGTSYAACIDAACVEARAAGTLSDALENVFQLASATRHRSLAETELGAPTSTRASRQLEALSAERIVEEELTAFRVATVSAEAPRAPVPAPLRRSSAALLPAYRPDEPGSATRIRVSIAPVEAASDRRSG